MGAPKSESKQLWVSPHKHYLINIPTPPLVQPLSKAGVHPSTSQIAAPRKSWVAQSKVLLNFSKRTCTPSD